ncbi:hypothetical protein HK57_00689 [Aspergillus ustus]|uniref:Heterokaryon incompatibility domain-containing protein n=1 Tax=Aspergillus ustus TaxID=40382 RepID=A0A0C1C3E4_ASPUT|nr:hypothetical protein HK57_00689 [Aspergillus ustus]
MRRNIATRYVWCDWACVPQGPDLGCELETVRREEIRKQVHIYKNARTSVVWIHSISWAEESSSALKQLLLLEISRAAYEEDLEVIKTQVATVEAWLREAKPSERWLMSSCWTLPRDASLIDRDGEKLRDERFCNGSHASVRDIATPISSLTDKLAMAYFIHAERGHDLDTKRLGRTRSKSFPMQDPEAVTSLRQSIKTLVASGLAGSELEEGPLYILAGRKTRGYACNEDSWWSLITGALGLENVQGGKVQVGNEEAVEVIKRQFLAVLIEKFQWEMLLLPFPECRIQERRCEDGEEELLERDWKWTDVVDGALLPISLFKVAVESPLGKLQYCGLPVLSFSYDNDALHITAGPAGQKMDLIRSSSEDITYFRHYRQDNDGLRIVSPQDVAFGDDPLLVGTWFLPLWDVDNKGGVCGKRCLLLILFNGEIVEEGATRAVFGGMIDVWGLGVESTLARELVVYPWGPEN